MSKYEVKVGIDFDPQNEIKVEVSLVNSEVTVAVNSPPKNKDTSKKVWIFQDWKVSAVAAIAMLVFSTAAYAAISGDYSAFDKILNAVVTIASANLEKDNVAKNVN